MQRQLSEIERHSATAGETGQPTRADWTQQSYFVIDSLDELLELAQIDFGPIYERAQGQPEYQPGEILAGDALIARGTGRYHADKRAMK